MMKNDDWAVAARELAAERRAELADRLPAAEEFEAFFRGELEEARAEEVREVLALYPELGEAFAPGEPADITAEDLALLTPAERLAGWHKLAARVGITTQPAAGELRPFPLPAAVPATRPARGYRWVLPFAAVLVGAGLGLWALGGLESGERQRIAVDFKPRGISDSAEPTVLRPVSWYYRLALELPWTEHALARYEVELVAEGARKESRWRAADLVAAGDHTLTVSFARWRLPRGVHFLRVTRTAPNEDPAVVTYTLRRE